MQNLKKNLVSCHNVEKPEQDLVLSVKNLTIGYRDRILVRNLNFEVYRQDFLCIVSSNGAGKTTLINTILGLLKPRAGQIAFENGLKPTEIGYMPQETKIDPHFPATVFEIVLSGTLSQTKSPFTTRALRQQVIKKLELLKIANLKNRSYAELSGGQKQKVLLSRALAATSKLLILDEPSNNLDAESKKDFFSLLTKLNQEAGLTIIMITHDLDHDNLIGNKVLSLKDHVFFGETEDFVKLIHHEKTQVSSNDLHRKTTTNAETSKITAGAKRC